MNQRSLVLIIFELHQLSQSLANRCPILKLTQTFHKLPNCQFTLWPTPQLALWAVLLTCSHSGGSSPLQVSLCATNWLTQSSRHSPRSLLTQQPARLRENAAVTYTPQNWLRCTREPWCATSRRRVFHSCNTKYQNK